MMVQDVISITVIIPQTMVHGGFSCVKTTSKPQPTSTAFTIIVMPWSICALVKEGLRPHSTPRAFRSLLLGGTGGGGVSVQRTLISLYPLSLSIKGSLTCSSPVLD